MADKSIDADVATFTISAQDASLLNGATGIYWSWEDQEILWGDDAGILFGFAYQRNWDTVSVSVTGGDISVARDYQIAADSASYSINAKDILLSDVNYILPADTSSFVISQPSIGLTKDWVLDADSASFDITDSVVSLEYSSLIVFDADTASFSVSASDSSLLAGREIAADTTAYAITASTIENDLGKTITAESASITVAASDISNIVDWQINTETTRIQILGGTLTFSTSEDAENPVFGLFDSTNIIRAESSLILIKEESITVPVGYEDMTDVVEDSSTIYIAKAS